LVCNKFVSQGLAMAAIRSGFIAICLTLCGLTAGYTADGGHEAALARASQAMEDGVRLRSVGDGLGAESRFREAYDIRQHILGLRDEKTLDAMLDLGGMLSDEGKRSEAGPLLLQGYRLRLAAAGENDALTKLFAHNYGVVLDRSGHYSEAEDFYRRAVVGLGGPGESSEEYALSWWRSVADAVGEQGRHAESIAIVGAAYETAKRTLGKYHPTTLSLRFDMAVDLGLMKLWSDAEPILLELEDEYRATDDLGDLLHTRANLAVCLSNEGKLKEAWSISREVYAERRNLLGDGAPETLTSEYNLAELELDDRDYNAAFDDFRKVYNARVTIFGADAPQSMNALTELGYAAAGQGDWQTAEDLYAQALQILRRTQGDDFPLTIRIRGSLGGLRNILRGRPDLGYPDLKAATDSVWRRQARTMDAWALGLPGGMAAGQASARRILQDNDWLFNGQIVAAWDWSHQP
jgi:tetratricopeptide (TPR) repeat protein